VRFNAALNAKNWDDVYASSKELMAKRPADFNGLELLLGSIGYDDFYQQYEILGPNAAVRQAVARRSPGRQGLSNRDSE